jgi:putative FmdB family regulatory protein
MPLYEYKCDQCGQVFEVIQKFSDSPLATHPACGGHVDRLLSAPAFHFKGTGWYATDYAKKNGNGTAHHSSSSKTETAEKAADAKSDSAKSDSAKSESAKSDSAKSESKTSKSSDTAATKS